MAILTNKPTSVSADSTTSLELNKADLQAKLEALSAGAYWEDQSTWRGVAFLFENASKQKVIASFDASGNTADLSVSEFFVDGDIECKRIDILGFANDHYTIYREDFTSASEFDIEITDGYVSGGGGGGPLQIVKLYDNYKYAQPTSGEAAFFPTANILNNMTPVGGYYIKELGHAGIAVYGTSFLNKITLTGSRIAFGGSPAISYIDSKLVVSIYEAVLGSEPGFPTLKIPVDGSSPVGVGQINVNQMPSNLTQFDVLFNNLALNPSKKYYAFCHLEISIADANEMVSTGGNYISISVGVANGFRAEDRFDNIAPATHPDAGLAEFMNDFNNDGILETPVFISKSGSAFGISQSVVPAMAAVYIGV